MRLVRGYGDGGDHIAAWNALARLSAALAATGIPAQARLDDKAPPLRITVEAAREIMEGVENG